MGTLSVFSKESGPKKPEIESFATLRASGYEKEVAFLTSKILVPFMNPGIYRNAGQSLPQGIILIGEKEEVSRFKAAIKTETCTNYSRKVQERQPLKNNNSAKWLQILFGSKFVTRQYFQKARADPDKEFVIFFHATRSKEMNGLENGRRFFSFVGKELRKSVPGQVLVVASVEDEGLVKDHSIQEMFPIRLAIPPRRPPTQGRKALLTAATSGWAFPPTKDILEDMAQKLGVGVSSKDGGEEEERIRHLAQSAYRICLEGYLKKEAGRGLKIDAKGINPTRQEWEEAFKMMESKGIIGNDGNKIPVGGGDIKQVD